MENKILDFKKYTSEWWREFLASHPDIRTSFSQEADGDVLYEVLFNTPPTIKPSWMSKLPSKKNFLEAFFKQFKRGYSESGYKDGQPYHVKKEFAYPGFFAEKIAEYAEDYDHPYDFFEGILQGGVESGVVYFLIYHKDCEEVYQTYKKEFEMFGSDGLYMGDKSIPRATRVCWSIFEKYAEDIVEIAFKSKLDNAPTYIWQARAYRINQHKNN